MTHHLTEKVADLQRQLQQAQEERDKAKHNLQIAYSEFVRVCCEWADERDRADAAIERAEDAEAWMDMVKNAEDFPKELLERAEATDRTVVLLGEQRDAAIDRAEAAEALLRRFGQWLRAEIRRGTLDLGFDPGWSAHTMLRELEREAPAEAQADQTDQADPTDPNP